MNAGVIDRFTDVFSRYIDSGFGLLGGEVAFLAATLIVIDVTLAGLFWAMGAEYDVPVRLIKKTLYVGFFAFLIGNFNALAKVVFNSFAGLGLKAAGAGLTAEQFLQPGRIAQVGIDAGKPILQAASQLLGFTLVLRELHPDRGPDDRLAHCSRLFFILAIQLFVTLIEFKLTTLAGFVLVPFGLFNKTAFLAERVLGNVVASGVKVLTLAIIVGIGTTLFGEFTARVRRRTTDARRCDGIGAGGALAARSRHFRAWHRQRPDQRWTATWRGRGGWRCARRRRLRRRRRDERPRRHGRARRRCTRRGVASGAARPRPIGPAQQRRVRPRAGAAVAGASSALRAGASAIAERFGGMVRPAATGASPAATSSAPAAPPEWAQRLRRHQTIAHGTSLAAHSVRSGDHGGGGTSISLSEDRR